ncbi:MAG: helix-turn-helix transcriptional regulator [Rhodospirillales bacterium]|nr:helix-turn-helix transcriptional regulator [Acetobacter sp.]
MAKRGRPPKNGSDEPDPNLPPIAKKLRCLRRAGGLTQEAIGAYGFISAPGWIKLENGKRAPSEALLEKLCDFLVAEKVVRAVHKKTLHEELCALKYVGHRSPFLRQLATDYLKGRVPVAI